MDIQRVFASLIVCDEFGREIKMQIRNQSGTVSDTIDLAMLDYTLANYGSLDRYLEVAENNLWIPSRKVTLKLVGTDGTIYPLPFETAYNDIIFKASECAMARGNRVYIENGSGNQMVDSNEFSVFFNDFLGSVLSKEGFELINSNYFKNYPAFNDLIKRYYQLSQKEDDMFAQAEAHRLEKNSFAGKEVSNPQNPVSINDFLRNYPIFRRAISFNIKCLEKRNSKIMRDANEKTVMSENKDSKIYEKQRSLCYLIGNNCAPLILKTMTASSLDKYTIEHYETPLDIKAENKELIEAYVNKHLAYVEHVRKVTSDSKYSGQLTILEHNEDGTFRRLPDGMYLRYPIIYTSLFEQVQDLYCNLARFRKEVRQTTGELKTLKQQIQATKVQAVYEDLEVKLKDALSELEEKKQITEKSRNETLESLKQIISDMQKLDREDKVEAKKNSNHHRLFSEHVSREIHYLKARKISTYQVKTINDVWEKEMKNSPYFYDQIRFILRTLRYKVRHNAKKVENTIDNASTSENTPIQKKANPTEPTIVREPESILYPDELEKMYGLDVPSNEVLAKKGIYVSRR